jgi:hypothetical protein
MKNPSSRRDRNTTAVKECFFFHNDSPFTKRPLDRHHTFGSDYGFHRRTAGRIFVSNTGKLPIWSQLNVRPIRNA